MTPQELLSELVTAEGPCIRLCAYCPEQDSLAEIKEVVEELLRKQYVLKQCNDDLMKEVIKIRKAYKEETGKEYPLEN